MDNLTNRERSHQLKNKILLTMVSILALIFFILYFFNLTHSRPYIVKKRINNVMMDIEYARTNNQQKLGLSRRESLLDNHAMLFIFPNEEPLFFWMHEMKFPIDIIWLDKNCKIIDISPKLQPCEENKTCPIISPKGLSQYVLETVSGFAEKNQLMVNQSLSVCH
jgi:uncharacterized membrane protein (UPF0127 family)